MAEAPPPSLRLRIDTQALAHNYRALDAMSGKAQAGAAVKANAYGLGVDACVPVLRDAGAQLFYVAHWSEAEPLLAHVDASNIRVLHGTANLEEASYAKAIGAVPVINSLHQAKIWSDAGGELCDLMVDTGINRLGISPHEIGDPIIQALNIDCLMSHLSSADEDSPMNARQLAAFTACTEAVVHKRLSLANSAGIALGADYAFDVTRPGLSLYGGIARPELVEVIRQVAYPEAAIMQKRNLKAGEGVGYNSTFTAPSAMQVGVVSIGYADGFLRSWNTGPIGAYLLHGEKRLPLLGKISMDMVVVDLSQAPELTEGDWLSLPYMLQHAAQQSSVSQYELLTVLGQRFGRI